MITKPKCKLTGEGNDCMKLTAKACYTLRHNGYNDLAKELQKRVIKSSKEFGDVWNIIGEYVEII